MCQAVACGRTVDFVGRDATRLRSRRDARFPALYILVHFPNGFDTNTSTLNVALLLSRGFSVL